MASLEALQARMEAAYSTPPDGLQFQLTRAKTSIEGLLAPANRPEHLRGSAGAANRRALQGTVDQVGEITRRMTRYAEGHEGFLEAQDRALYSNYDLVYRSHRMLRAGKTRADLTPRTEAQQHLRIDRLQAEHRSDLMVPIQHENLASRLIPRLISGNCAPDQGTSHGCGTRARGSLDEIIPILAPTPAEGAATDADRCAGSATSTDLPFRHACELREGLRVFQERMESPLRIAADCRRALYDRNVAASRLAENRSCRNTPGNCELGGLIAFTPSPEICLIVAHIGVPSCAGDEPSGEPDIAPVE